MKVTDDLPYQYPPVAESDSDEMREARKRMLDWLNSPDPPTPGQDGCSAICHAVARGEYAKAQALLLAYTLINS